MFKRVNRRISTVLMASAVVIVSSSAVAPLTFATSTNSAKNGNGNGPGASSDHVVVCNIKSGQIQQGDSSSINKNRIKIADYPGDAKWPTVRPLYEAQCKAQGEKPVEKPVETPAKPECPPKKNDKPAEKPEQPKTPVVAPEQPKQPIKKPVTPAPVKSQAKPVASAAPVTDVVPQADASYVAPIDNLPETGASLLGLLAAIAAASTTYGLAYLAKNKRS